jgi:hypothetical protein
MKVLTAAPYTVGGVEIGRCNCVPGELVMLTDACECDCHPFDDEDCGCQLDCEDGPPFSGLVSFATTTTARIEECAMTAEELRRALCRALEQAGWFVPGVQPDIAQILVDLELGRIQQAAEAFPVGTLVSAQNGRIFAVSELATRAPARRQRAGPR